MNTTILLFAVATFLSTLFGGLVIFKFRKGLPFFFAFAAGALIAVAFLDLLPESLEIAAGAGISVRTVMLTIVASFFVYSLLERFFVTHSLDQHHGHAHIFGPVGAGSLVVHSFLDGIAIGAAFQVSASIGIVVAFAVIFHDFTDGINTVTLMLKNKHKNKNAFFFLLLDALAPVVGILVTGFFVPSQQVLALILAFFVGEFVYMGGAHLLPETKHHGSKWIIFAIALGIAVITLLTSFLSF